MDRRDQQRQREEQRTGLEPVSGTGYDGEVQSGRDVEYETQQSTHAEPEPSPESSSQFGSEPAPQFGPESDPQFGPVPELGLEETSDAIPETDLTVLDLLQLYTSPTSGYPLAATINITAPDAPARTLHMKSEMVIHINCET